jgi:alpha-L-fucosidase 2
MKFRLTIAALMAFAGCAGGGSAQEPRPAPSPADSRLWYDRPARSWMTEALPIGEGALGAMIFGLTATERIQFNHDTLWTGTENDTGSYEAFGDVFIELGHDQPTDYRRELDIDRSVQTVTYKHRGVTYRREAFASHPAHAIVIRLTADGPAAHSGRIWLTDMHGAKVIARGSRLIASGRLSESGMKYESQLQVLNSGGTVRVGTSPAGPADNPLAGVPGTETYVLPRTYIEFEGCTSLTLILAADTDYVPDHTRSWRGEDPHREVTQRIDRASRRPVARMLAEHIADYRSLFRRFRLDLGTTAPAAAERPTDQRLIAYTREKTRDPDLEELFAQYGRYLMISSSRAGDLPANLQGVWNESNDPPWRGDYHSNINVQMNYWPAEATNLGDLHRPLIDYFVSQVPIARRRTREADEYGPNVRGWTVRTENGVFGGGSFKWNPPGSAWYAQHVWEHYAFSQDKAYLRQIAYPFIKEVVEYWEDTLVRRPDGTLVSPLGWSPEHGPTEPGVTYDQMIIHDLFTNYIEASEALGVDAEYRARVAEMRSSLLKPKIGQWGQLQEWETDRDDPEEQHVHASHLFGLYPGRQITATQTPALFEAARISLLARGDGGTGWSRAWKINFWARFHDGDHAYRMLRNLLTASNNVGNELPHGGGVYPNLLDAHPPFQIDGNFGSTAGVAEMLVQSHEGYIHLLPALPSAWPDGSVRGLRARGGYEIDMSWRGGELASATVRNVNGSGTQVRYAGRQIAVTVPRGESVEVAPATFGR